MVFADLCRASAMMRRHFFLCDMNNSFPESSTSLPSWFGFVLGLLAGFASSAVLIGLVLGYSLGGSFSGGLPARGGTVTQRPPSAPTAPPAPEEPTAAVAAVTDKDHVRGNPDAKITIIEYSDFECPFCKRHVDTIEKILAKYKNDVNFVYRHFPLGFHANAQKEAEASECVAELAGNDAFWKFHDLLFERSTVGGTGFALDKLPALAKEVGANEAKFRDCLDSGKHEQNVKDQMDGGVAAGVQGTPGNFVINNATKEQRNISGAVPAATFEAVIDAMLKS